MTTIPKLALSLALSACMLSGGYAQSGLTRTAPEPFSPSVGQGGKDVVWVPTPQALVDRMLDMAGLTKDDYVIDLGSGDGRTVITAAQRGARAKGLEYNPKMVQLSRRNAEAEGVGKRASFEQADIFKSDFSKASLITRGLAETSRLGEALGADPLTFAGLAGVGDLIATCMSPLSRNRTFGERLGRGMSVEEVTASTRQVAEGVKSCLSILELARAHGVDLPITASVVAVVHHGLAPREMGMRLLSRARRPEQD